MVGCPACTSPRCLPPRAFAARRNFMCVPQPVGIPAPQRACRRCPPAAAACLQAACPLGTTASAATARKTACAPAQTPPVVWTPASRPNSSCSRQVVAPAGFAAPPHPTHPALHRRQAAELAEVALVPLSPPPTCTLPLPAARRLHQQRHVQGHDLGRGQRPEPQRVPCRRHHVHADGLERCGGRVLAGAGQWSGWPALPLGCGQRTAP